MTTINKALETSVQMETQLDITNSNKEETKHDEVTDDSKSASSSICDELFYIYYKHKISGPCNHYDIIKKYISNEIEEEIWVKNVASVDTEKEDKWYKVSLSNQGIEDANKKLKEKFPVLYDYLILKIKNKEVKQYQPPIDTPSDIVGKISFTSRVIIIVGNIVFWPLVLIIALHVLPTLCIAMCCFALPWMMCVGDDTTNKENIVWIGSICISVSGILVVPFIIVYVILLDAVDYQEWNGELQSWMVAYVTWGVCSYLFILMCTIAALDHMGSLAEAMIANVFWIIGVDFGQIDFETLFSHNDTFGFAMVLVYPALGAALPSAIVGFIANFVLEEKFELKCNDEIINDTLCFDEKFGCCEVISSHDVRNTYAFIGGLASNILATWAFIRIVGYLMVNINPEVSMLAKRNK
eukprot:297068_1